MARNNLRQHPESINDQDQDQCENSQWCHHYCGGGETTTRSIPESSSWAVAATNRLRIGNIGATYLFIGLLLLFHQQSGYLCHGTYATLSIYTAV